MPVRANGDRQEYVFHMEMNPDYWAHEMEKIKAKHAEMLQTLAGLKKLRTEAVALPESVLTAIDGAIATTKSEIDAIKRDLCFSQTSL